MARMIPAFLPKDLRSPAEPLVFEALRDDPATVDWTVLHSVDIARHVSRPFGEADFVVIIPGWGLVVIEVKGVRSISRAPDGGWLLGSRSSSDPVGPFRQARDAMFSIREEIASKARGVRLMTTSMVMMPFIPLGMESIEWDAWEAADRPVIDRYGYVGAVRRAMNGQEERLGRTPDGGMMSESMVEDVIRVLRPSFEVHIAPSERLADMEARTRSYTEEQFAALDAMDANARVIFDGAAGTGKTLLAIESARRASASGVPTLLLCFNRLLGDHLREEVAHLQGVEAATVHSHMLRTSGLEAPEVEDEAFWREILPEAATTAALERGADVGLLIVDEAQDVLLDDALRTYLDALLVGELSNGRWQAFGDFTNQAIFAGDTLMPATLDAVPKYSLVKNCRNAPAIAHAAAAVGRLGLGYRTILREDDGPALRVASYRDDQGLVSSVLASVAALMEEGYEAQDIAILVPRADSAVARMLDVASREGGTRGRGTTPVHTVQAFKGLESQAIVLAGIDAVDSEYWRSVLYVGITRARHSAHILVHAPVRQRFDGIIAEGRP